MDVDVELPPGPTDALSPSVDGVQLINLVSSGANPQSIGSPIKTSKTNDENIHRGRGRFTCFDEVSTDISTKALMIKRNREYFTDEEW